MRLSRMLPGNSNADPGDSIPLRRAMLWVVVWIGLLAGIVLYFRYARFLTPLLG